MLKEADVAVRALGLRLQRVEAREPADLDRAFAEMARGRAGAVSVLGSTMFSNERRRLVELTARARLPAVYTSREFVEAGDLMAYGPNVGEMYRRAAGYVDRILKGAVPAELPVEQASKFELLINLRTARTLGLTIPPSLLQRADQVIE
jgi:putative ABC transport system substrate-binding protein